MKGKYHVLELGSKGAEETIQKFCQTNGQMPYGPKTRSD